MRIKPAVAASGSSVHLPSTSVRADLPGYTNINSSKSQVVPGASFAHTGWLTASGRLLPGTSQQQQQHIRMAMGTRATLLTTTPSTTSSTTVTMLAAPGAAGPPQGSHPLTSHRGQPTRQANTACTAHSDGSFLLQSAAAA